MPDLDKLVRNAISDTKRMEDNFLAGAEGFSDTLFSMMGDHLGLNFEKTSVDFLRGCSNEANAPGVVGYGMRFEVADQVFDGYLRVEPFKVYMAVYALEDEPPLGRKDICCVKTEHPFALHVGRVGVFLRSSAEACTWAKATFQSEEVGFSETKIQSSYLKLIAILTNNWVNSLANEILRFRRQEESKHE